MTDMELAKIEQLVADLRKYSSKIGYADSENERASYARAAKFAEDQIIAALRREPEEEWHHDLRAWRYNWSVAIRERDQWMKKAEGMEAELKELRLRLRPPSGEMVMVPREPTRETILAINAAYWQLEEQTEIIGQGRASVDEHARTLYRAMLSACEEKK